MEKKTLNHKFGHSPSSLTSRPRPHSPDGRTSTGLPALLVVPEFLSPRHGDVVNYISTQIDLPLSQRGDVDCKSASQPFSLRCNVDCAHHDFLGSIYWNRGRGRGVRGCEDRVGSSLLSVLSTNSLRRIRFVFS